MFGPIGRRCFYNLWSDLRHHAQVDFTPHDIRRTACSEIDKAVRGMGKVLLLHAPSSVTERSYLNALPELREAVEAMAVPISFKHGPKMAKRAFDSSRRERIKMHADTFALPEAPAADQFEFVPGGVAMAGRTMIVKGHKWRILKRLAEAGGPVTLAELWTATYATEWPDNRDATMLVRKYLVYLRKRLRAWLGLPDDWNPIPIATSQRWSDCTRYTLSIPPITRERKAS